MLYAQVRESLETLLFFFAKTESKMIAVIATKKFASEFSVAGVTDPGYSLYD